MSLKRSILDRLDDNTKVIGRMKAYFPSEYGLYSQIGAVIVPHDDPFLRWKELATEPVSPWFDEIRPSFGAVVTGRPNDETKGADEPLCARLTHFLKIEQAQDIRQRMFRRDHQTIQPIAPTSNLYIFTLYYDERDWARLFPRKSRADWKMCKFFERAFAVELPVEITKDGCARPLKIMREKGLKRPITRQDSYSDACRTVKRWEYPYSKEYLAELKWRETPTPEEFILAEVGVTLRCYEEANASMIQVRATKNGVCTLVNVNVEATPSFFDDREDVIEGNAKKKIFHIVRANERIGSRGVRLHFRGLREFVWNGYQIDISVPGRDHLDVKEFNVTAVREEDDYDLANSTDLADIGGWLVANQKVRFGAMVGKSGKLIPLNGHEAPRSIGWSER